MSDCCERRASQLLDRSRSQLGGVAKMLRWVAVCSTPAAQPRVCVALTAFDHEAFMPMETFWKPHRFGKREKAFVPLFIGYTFARVDPSRIGEIMAIEGVRDVLRSATGKPLAIPDQVIGALRQAFHSRLFDRTKSARFIDGEPVRILDGPFSGLLAKVKSASSRHRTKVLLKFLGQLTEAEVPIDKIEKIHA